MGAFEFTQLEFTGKVIARPPEAATRILWKWPERSIQVGAHLTVCEGECAVFFFGDEPLGVLAAGEYQATVEALPFLSQAVNYFTGGIELVVGVYFVQIGSLPPAYCEGGLVEVTNAKTCKRAEAVMTAYVTVRIAEPSEFIAGCASQGGVDGNDDVMRWVQQVFLTSATDALHLHFGERSELSQESLDEFIPELVCELEAHAQAMQDIGVMIEELVNVKISLEEF